MRNLESAVKIISKFAIKSPIDILCDTRVFTVNGEVHLSKFDTDTYLSVGTGEFIEGDAIDKVVSSDKIKLYAALGNSDVNSWDSSDDIENYPEYLDKGKLVATLYLNVSELSAVAYAMAKDDVRYFLNGAVLSYNETAKFSLAASDGHRLAWINKENNHLPNKVLIPRDAVLLATKVFSDKLPIKADIYNEFVVFEQLGVTLSSKLIDASYPSFEKVFEREITNHVTIDSALITKLKALPKPSKKAFAAIVFRFEGRRCEVALASGEVLATYETDSQPDLKIGIHQPYLLELIKHTSSKSLSFSAGHCIMGDGLVMAMRV
jgi:DNA polymerase III sliding clamp (beta) subunit (PCNA family)